MNIDMINTHSVNRKMDMESQYGSLSSTDSRMKTSERGYSLDITGTVMENAAYGKDELKSASDIAQEAGLIDVSLQRDYMAVMSNSMSSDDFGKLMSEGVNPTQTTVEESVTNLDKIKIAMAEAGITIEGYNDDLSAEEIASVVGNAGLAESLVANTGSAYIESEGSGEAQNTVAMITDTLQSFDLPINEATVEDMEKVLDTAKEIEPLSESSMVYMLENDLTPTIENLYRAEHSSSAGDYVAAGANFSGMSTYAGTASSIKEWEKLEGQVVEIVKASGMEMEEGISAAKWLVEHQIPINESTLKRYEQLKEINMPLDEQEVIKAMAVAVENGQSPKEADVTQTESLYEKAVRIVYDFSKMDDAGDIHKRRQLEEIRLAMSAEANLTLLRKGIQIETQPLEELVEKLKEAEREFYRPLLEDNTADRLDGKDDTVDAQNISLDEKINLFKATSQIVADLPNTPVRVIAEAVADTDMVQFTLDGLNRNSQISRASYEKAGEAYETLMTAPRADMGDSIKKAFANVDDILDDLEIDINEVNRKAVRTLGYAQMQISRENIESVREATMTVNRVIELMSPARVLKMIKDGHNPLNENLYSLEKSLSKESVEETNEKYSQFLYKLEKTGQVTDEEREAYIGMYRLFKQIEKQDGKVIGNVLSNGQELTLKNMLAASRSNRHKNMDIKVDDDFGLLEEIIEKGDSISEQISRGFSDIMARPVDSEYIEEKLAETESAAKAPAEAERILEELQLPVTVENMVAVKDMILSGEKSVRKLFGDKDREDADADVNEDIEILQSAADDIISDFTDREAAKSAYEIYMEKALKTVKESVENADTYVEAKDWSFIYKQLSLASKMVRNESYEVPVRTGEGYTSIHLTIKHTQGEKGKVSAKFDSARFGRVNAQFSVGSRGVDGLIVSDSRAGVEELKAVNDRFVDGLNKSGIATDNLSYVYSARPIDTEYMPQNNNDASNSELYKLAKAFVMAIAEKE